MPIPLFLILQKLKWYWYDFCGGSFKKWFIWKGERGVSAKKVTKNDNRERGVMKKVMLFGPIFFVLYSFLLQFNFSFSRIWTGSDNVPVTINETSARGRYRLSPVLSVQKILNMTILKRFFKTNSAGSISPSLSV